MASNTFRLFLDISLNSNLVVLLRDVRDSSSVSNICFFYLVSSVYGDRLKVFISSKHLIAAIEWNCGEKLGKQILRNGSVTIFIIYLRAMNQRGVKSWIIIIESMQ